MTNISKLDERDVSTCSVRQVLKQFLYSGSLQSLRHILQMRRQFDHSSGLKSSLMAQAQYFLELLIETFIHESSVIPRVPLHLGTMIRVDHQVMLWCQQMWTQSTHQHQVLGPQDHHFLCRNGKTNKSKQEMH